MPKLSNTTVMRGGVTASRITLEPTSINLTTRKGSRPSVVFYFSMRSKGGGKSHVEVRVQPDDFPAILAAMSDVGQLKALKAMSKESAKQIAALK